MLQDAYRVGMGLVSIEARDRDAIAALGDPGRWLEGASALLADLGFTLIRSDRPGIGDGSHLLVALRPAPTLRHFDPEAVTLWVAAAGRGRARVVERSNIAHAPDSVLWGHVHVVDRLEVENRFLTFGGELRTAPIGDGTVLVDLRSPGPIVRWGGHSQGEDPLAGEIGAFFGRLIIPIDYEPDAEARVSAATPLTLYGSFLVDAIARSARARQRTEGSDPLAAWIEAEAGRIHRTAPEAWEAGGALLEAIGLPAGG